MKISQVISRLQDIQRQYGDLDVYVRRESEKEQFDLEKDKLCII